VGNLACYAVVTPGLEAIAAAELQELAAHDIEAGEGGVSFSATMDGLFRINLRSRVCTRILIRLASFRALSFPELYNKSKKVAWEHYLGADTSVSVRVSCSHSKLVHSGRAETAISDAIADRLGFAVQDAAYEQQVLLRIDNNQCTLSLDTSGDRLDRRGYRMHSGKAPVRETIAAAILQWMDWQPDEPLLSPMCGSGTFAVEAAWMLQKRASGLEHAFPFSHWPSLKEKRWQRALEKARAMKSDHSACIMASELDAGILKQAQGNAAQAGVADLITFQRLDVRKMRQPERIETPGLIVCNPPYGDRVKSDAGVDVKGIYADLGDVFRRHFSDWRIAVMVPDQSCEKALGLKVRGRLKIKHGGKWVHVLRLSV